MIIDFDGLSLFRNDHVSFFKRYNHQVPYRRSLGCATDPFWKLFEILACDFDEFFKSRKGVRFNFNGIETNRSIVKDWDDMILRLSGKSKITQPGHIGVVHPMHDHITGDMRSKFNIIWFDYESALKIMSPGYLSKQKMLQSFLNQI